MTVVPSEYKPEWVDQFNQEKALIAEGFPLEGILMEHIGSTVVYDLKAKPITDITVGVISIPEEMKTVIDHLSAAKYEYAERHVPPTGAPKLKQTVKPSSLEFQGSGG